MSIAKLKKEDRLRLMRFVCSFAWADLEVKESEKKFVRKLVKSLKLSKDEAKLVEKWLKLPPKAEEGDPAEIPRAHRQLFLDATKAMIAADGEIAEEEAESFRLLQMLMR